MEMTKVSSHDLIALYSPINNKTDIYKLGFDDFKGFKIKL